MCISKHRTLQSEVQLRCSGTTATVSVSRNVHVHAAIQEQFAGMNSGVMQLFGSLVFRNTDHLMFSFIDLNICSLAIGHRFWVRIGITILSCIQRRLRISYWELKCRRRILNRTSYRCSQEKGKTKIRPERRISRSKPKSGDLHCRVCRCSFWQPAFTGNIAPLNVCAR